MATTQTDRPTVKLRPDKGLTLREALPETSYLKALFYRLDG